MRASLSAVLALFGALLMACGGGSPALHAGPMPAGGTFTGVWFSPEYGEMHVQQNGATVIGRFEKGEKTGRIQGTVDGDLLRFEWTQKRELIVGRATASKGHGYFRVFEEPAEKSWKIAGRWGLDDSETNGGDWTAIRARSRQPDLDGDGMNDEEGGSSESSGSEESESSSGNSGSDDLSDL